MTVKSPIKNKHIWGTFFDNFQVEVTEKKRLILRGAKMSDVR
jgi:hypothetical protein